MQFGFKQVERYQYVGLFTVLVGVIFVHPYTPRTGSEVVLAVLVALIPAMAIVALVEDRVMLFIGVVLAIPATFVLIDDAWGNVLVHGLAARLTPLAFYLYATGVICYHVVTETRVRADTLLGAICGYLMLGYSWSWAYSTLIMIEPESFASSYGSQYAPAGSMFYFSFVTLTTLGYGDIVPLTAKARSLAMMESITGVLYLAVLVSRLVALYGSSAREGARGRGPDELESGPE